MYTYPLEGEMTEYEFVYDKDQSYEINFRRWYNMNCSERSHYNEKLYTEEEGEKVFKSFLKNAS